MSEDALPALELVAEHEQCVWDEQYAESYVRPRLLNNLSLAKQRLEDTRAALAKARGES